MSPAGPSSAAQETAVDELEMREDRGAVIFRIRVQPGARRDEIAGFSEGGLKLRIAAPPVEGKANRACVEFLAHVLGVRRSCVEIVGGERARDKLIKVLGISKEEAWRRLSMALAGGDRAL